jgi:hypothetical protein
MSPTFDLQTLIIVGLIGVILGMLAMAGNQVRIRIEQPGRSEHESLLGGAGGCAAVLAVIVAFAFAVYLITQTLR